MLFGRKKPGFVLVEPAYDEKLRPDVQPVESVTAAETVTAAEAMEKPGSGEKPELMEYLASLPEAEDPYAEPGASEEMGEEVEELPLTQSQKLAGYIRIRSQAAKLTGSLILKAEIPDFEELIRECGADETCGDIQSVQGSKDIYYYSSDTMSGNYAKIASLVEEKNLPETIAQMVRFNCRTYPAPTPWSYFNKHPYYATDPQMERAAEVLNSEEAYQDISLFQNSRGVRYFFAASIMSERYAKALAEDEPYTD